MKKVYIILLATLMLTGCNLNSLMPEEDMNFSKEGISVSNAFETNDPLENYFYLDEGLKTQLRELYELWKKFDNSKVQDKDPTEDFHNSEYISEFKNFLSQRESLAVSKDKMSWILGQHGLETSDKTILLSNGTEYNIRVISYNVNYYVQAITDFVGLRNNWIFVQCWNEDDFYFTTLSDGDIHTAHDFFPLEIDGIFHIILEGTSFPSYPQPPFLWAWHLESDGFKKSSLFDFQAVETDSYFIYDNVDLANNHCCSASA